MALITGCQPLVTQLEGSITYVMLGLSSFVVGMLVILYELGTKRCSHRLEDLEKT